MTRLQSSTGLAASRYATPSPTRLERTFEMPQPVQATLLTGPAYELRAEIHHTAYGHHVRLLSFVPSARRPEEQVKFQGLFSTDQLRALRDLIDQEIGA